MKKIILGVFMLICFQFQAQNIENEAKTKIRTLEKLIKKADKKGIDVLKEKTTIATAETFLKFANWDENNVETNAKLYKLVTIYKKNAQEMAEQLPNFERGDVVKMLDASIDELSLILKKKQFRQASVQIDWTKAKLEKDQITYKNRPVFVSDYTWKPNDSKLETYFGNQDGFFLTPSYLVSKKGAINKRVMDNLKAKPNGSLGFIFLNHKSVPKWASSEYGQNFKMREDTYTAYDIDHPGAREIQATLLEKTVPYMAGKKFSELGYMLCNEPHFFTQKTGNKKAWASGPVSEYTINKFQDWLQNKHQNIANLNSLWQTNFNAFENVSIQIPIDTSLKGSPIWYDWALFNMNRVTEWYQFLKSEIVKHDADAKVHIKIMPNLWTENKRIHGIDLEALTDLSGIVGNDSGAENNHMWGKKEEWEDHYAFNWRELCMGFDFMKSVSPNKINYNTEVHYLSTVKSRELYQDPAYARATFWLAHVYGMTASQIWYWPRNADGSVSKKALNDKGYAGSNNQQPRVTNEVAMTMIDLNANAEEIMAMQRQRKPLRVFYSKTSAINKKQHMDDVFELYESLHFNGTSIGFATKDILNKQDAENWDAVLIAKTEFVTKDEVIAVQDYLNNGGTVFIDQVSFKKNEYGQELNIQLKASKGTLITLNSTEEITHKAINFLESKKLLPEITITETNSLNVKGCVWRVVKNNKGNNVLNVVNIGKTEATIQVAKKGENIICKDIIKGIEVSSNPTLKPYEVYYVEIQSK